MRFKIKMRPSILALLVLTFACATKGEVRQNEKKDPPAFVLDAYDKAANRLTPTFVQDGWIISRYTDGSTEHEGDSLIWTGLAMAALSCDRGAVFENRMIRMISENQGALVRYEPLGEYANGREVTFDGATGLYYGVFQRLRRCSTEDKWREVWKKHIDYLAENDYVLHPNVNSVVMPQFNAMRDYVTFQLGLGDEPEDWRYRALEAEANVWSSVVVESRQPCFRVHLAWLHLSFLEDSNNLLRSAAWGFCVATDEANVPLYDHWCGRRDIDEWVDEFEFDQWEYRHQRCHGDDWETPDGRPNLRTPGLDLLFAIAFVYPEVLNAD